ncbi:MAG: hypothetical protein NC419_03815 [Muribaculaceae bacterium]|nr:hypothetical protein [Muribaculaceae bacterium]
MDLQRNVKDINTKNVKKGRKMNAKSYLAVFLSVVLLFTSIDCAQVQAKETAVGSGAVWENTERITEEGQTGDTSAEFNGGEGGMENPENKEGGEGSGNPGTPEDKEDGEGSGNTESPEDKGNG